MNGFIKTSRVRVETDRPPRTAFNPRWVVRIPVASGPPHEVEDGMVHPHGWVFGEKEFGHFPPGAVKTPDGRVHAAPAEFVAEARRQLASPVPRAVAHPPVRPR